MMKHFCVMMLLVCIASASAVAVEDPSSIFKLDNNYTEKVTETDRSYEFITILPDLPNLNSCTYPGSCPSLTDARNCTSCQVGYVKDLKDDTKCKYANETENAFLLTSDSDNIRTISLDGKNTSQIFQNGKFSKIRSMDYNFRTDTLFWFSYTDKTIYTASLLNNVDFERKIIMHDDSSFIDGIAVDWIYNHIYWVDNGRDELVVSNFNGTMKKVLFKVRFLWPTAIVVNPLSGWMYFTDSFKGHIERAGLDGLGREVILRTEGYHLQNLALDLVENRLYWSLESSRGGFSSIWSSNVDGSDRQIILRETKESQLTGGDFRKIALFDKYIYLMDWDYDVLYKVNKCNGQELEMVYNSTVSVFGLKVYHSTMQPEGQNLCSNRAHKCSHFCFPAQSPKNEDSMSTTTCACPDGLYLSSDERSCVSKI